VNTTADEKIQPSIVVNGRIYYPTGIEWLIFFASHGCEWAIEALKRAELKEKA
jgi:hypothetical protein